MVSHSTKNAFLLARKLYKYLTIAIAIFYCIYAVWDSCVFIKQMEGLDDLRVFVVMLLWTLLTILVIFSFYYWITAGVVIFAYYIYKSVTK